MTAGWFDPLVKAIGDLARPSAIYMIGYASAWAIHQVSLKVENGNDGAIFLGSVAALVTIVVGARALENINADRQAAKVETARAQADSAPAEPPASV